LADGIKAPKEGKRMPAVKLLHQESQNNTKPEYIMGHSLQAISLLVHAGAGQVAAVPLISRIHEGLVFSNRDAKTLLDKLVALLLSITLICNKPVVLVADAYYASGKVITPLLAKGHHLVTGQDQCGGVSACAQGHTHPGKGRPRIYGQKVRLKDMATDDRAFTSAPSPVYGESDVMVRFRVLDLLWKPVGRVVRFCIVHHPVRGTIFLLSTDTSLSALEILQLYGYRFKIELGFRQAVHVMGAYAITSGCWDMKPLRRGSRVISICIEPRTSTGEPSAESCAPTMCMFSSAVSRRGLLQHLAINHTAEVWRCFRSWLRTMNPAMPPSELIVAQMHFAHPARIYRGSRFGP
jgi:hypothetical protein